MSGSFTQGPKKVNPSNDKVYPYAVEDDGGALIAKFDNPHDAALFSVSADMLGALARLMDAALTAGLPRNSPAYENAVNVMAVFESR